MYIYICRMPGVTHILSPEVKMRLLERHRPTFRRRNKLTALGVLGWVFGMYCFTIMAVKQESIVDADFDKRKITSTEQPQ